MAINGLSGHVAGTSALPPTTDIRAPRSGIRVFMSGSPPASDVPGTPCHPKRPVRPCRGGRRRRRGRVWAPFRCYQRAAPIIDFRFSQVLLHARARNRITLSEHYAASPNVPPPACVAGSTPSVVPGRRLRELAVRSPAGRGMPVNGLPPNFVVQAISRSVARATVYTPGLVLSGEDVGEVGCVFHFAVLSLLPTSRPDH